jgi:hypothetical protein
MINILKELKIGNTGSADEDDEEKDKNRLTLLYRRNI